MTEPFRISSGEVDTKDSLILRIEREGLVGYGEASPMAGGFYSAETPESTFNFLCEEVLPFLITERAFSPEFAARHFNEDRREPFAWAGLEGALLDLYLREKETSIPGWMGADIHPVESGLALGIYPTVEKLLAMCEKHLQDGYKRLKIKIEPGWDIEPLKAVRESLGEIPLMVDANAAYSENHFPLFEELDTFGLLMIEQPLAPQNIEGHRRLQERITTPLCFDEGASGLSTVKTAIRTGACRIVNLKIQRLGGITGAFEMMNACAAEGVPTWVGTMPELGIGALHALYLSLLPNNCYPTDVESSGRWFEEDIIDPPIEVRDGTIEIPAAHHQRPNVSEEIVEKYTLRRKELSF